MSKSKKEKIFGFDQWGKKQNRSSIYFGCYNSCEYCGVRRTQCLWLKNRDFHKWHLMEFNKTNYKENIGKRDGLSICFTAHDIFPFNRKLCFNYLKRLIHPKKDVYNKVLLVSKARKSVFNKLVDEFKDYRDYLETRFTITTMDHSLLKFWESNAPNYPERKECLELCYEKGFKTSLSIEPLLDPYPFNSLFNMIDALSPFISSTIWIGYMNRISSEEKLIERNYTKKQRSFYENIRKDTKTWKLKEIIDQLNSIQEIRYKDSFIRRKNLLKHIPSFQIAKNS